MVVMFALALSVTPGSYAADQAATNAPATNASATNALAIDAPAANAPTANQPTVTSTPAAGVARTGTSGGGDGGFGVGVILGEPTGLSLKCWVTEKTAIDGGVAYSFKDTTSFHFHSDFLWHNFDLLPVTHGRLAVYYGVGGRVKFERNTDTRAGVRGPIGLAYMFEQAPVDIFVEIAPILDVTPSTKFGINGGVGVRYYFRR
jgi:hypothetical protein